MTRSRFRENDRFYLFEKSHDRMSLGIDLLVDLCSLVTDYFVHGLTLPRILLRLLTLALLFGGFALMLVGSRTLGYVGLGLALLAGPIVLYDTLTAHWSTRS